MSDPSQARFPVDMQLHSTASDGTDSQTALVQLAASRGVRVLSLTDHDSVLGVDEAMRAGKALGLWVLPSLDFSTPSALDRDYADINILTYVIDPHPPQLSELLQRVIDIRIE